MIFASDLDRTLIYSDKFLTESMVLDKDYFVVEQKEERNISHMTKKAYALLEEIHKKCLFIPVTARTIKEYSRINIFRDKIVPKYAIVSNGGNILINGVPDEIWNKNIKEQLKNEHISHKYVREKMELILSDDWIFREYMAEDLFFYYIIDANKIPYNKIYDFEIWLKENKWNLSIQGRKMYIMPNCLDKWKAISYIMENEDLDKVVAAGDSLLDLKMLNKANYSISPSHGEIKKRIFESGRDKVTINFTEKTGMLASEEIFEKLLQYLDKEV